MPGRAGTARCTGCSYTYEFSDGGSIEWEEPRRPWGVEHLVCTKCLDLHNVQYFYDSEHPDGAPNQSPPRCNKSSCRRVLRPWPGVITPDTLEGPCPRCGSPLIEEGGGPIWD